MDKKPSAPISFNERMKSAGTDHEKLTYEVIPQMLNIDGWSTLNLNELQNAQKGVEIIRQASAKLNEVVQNLDGVERNPANRFYLLPALSYELRKNLPTNEEGNITGFNSEVVFPEQPKLLKNIETNWKLGVNRVNNILRILDELVEFAYQVDNNDTDPEIQITKATSEEHLMIFVNENYDKMVKKFQKEQENEVTENPFQNLKLKNFSANDWNRFNKDSTERFKAILEYLKRLQTSLAAVDQVWSDGLVKQMIASKSKGFTMK